MKIRRETDRGKFVRRQSVRKIRKTVEREKFGKNSTMKNRKKN